MKILLSALAILLICATAFSQNVLIGNQNNPNEPSIMFNPKNPNMMVAAANINNLYYSSDMGATWTYQLMTSSHGVWGDPVIDVDTSGAFYFTHLSNPSTGNWIDRIVCQKSIDNGATWNDGSFTGLNGTKAQDKQWSIIDKTNNNIYLTWTQFDDYGSSNPADVSTIMFSKSLDGGATWSPALKINDVDGDCIDEDNTVEGATPALGPNGEIYVSWVGPNGIVFKRSLDQGNTWSSEISVTNVPGGWDYSIPGINRANGLPITKCDLSGGPNHGTIYVNWSDQRNGVDDTDIWLTQSSDGGDTWAAPSRVNDDPAGKQQFFTWMDIDQTNGNLWFIFYDRRAYTDNNTDVYLAQSDDGGNTFLNIKISESPFVPNPGVFFGDYTNIVVDNDLVRPIWTRLNNGNLSVWTDITPSGNLVSIDNQLSQVSLNNLSQYPNPATNVSYLSFKLHEASEISAQLFDQQGRFIHQILSSQTLDYGKHILSFNVDDLNLTEGVYYTKLTINGSEKMTKTVIHK